MKKRETIKNKYLYGFILAIVLSLSNQIVNAQEKISLNFANIPLEEAIKKIESSSKYTFFYDANKTDLKQKVSLNATDQSIESVVASMLRTTNLTFEIDNRQIALIAKKTNDVPKKRISGIIKDETGEPVIGVSVAEKGTTNGIITDIDGAYILDVSPQSTITISYVGYITQQIKVGDKANISVILQEDSKLLDEVVVVGYGIQKKANLTGAVSVVKGDDMIKRPVTNAAAMLQSQMPGLRVNQGSGEPGNNGVTFRVRGQGTYSGAGNSPMVLINGVPGDISSLDPNAIESVSVLKDAASAAVYGARAANGVILVTTKSGENKPTSITYSGNLQVSNPTRMIKLVTNSVEYMQLYNEANANSGRSNRYSDDIIDLYRNAGTGSYEYPSYDWLGEYIGTALSHNHNLGITGGSEKMSYNVMMNYSDEEGTMKGFDYQRYNVTVDLQSKITNWIKFGAYVNLKRGDRNQLRQGSNDAFLSLTTQAPTYRPQRADGKWVNKAYGWESPNKNVAALIANDITKKTIDYDVNSQAWITVDIIKGLTWHTKGAVRLTHSREKDWRTTVPLYNFHTGEGMSYLDVGGSGLSVRNDQRFYSNFYTYLKYDFDLLDKAHNFGLQFGYTQESEDYEWSNGYRRDYNFPLPELNAGTTTLQEATGTSESWAIQSLFGRLNYNFKERYLFEGNFRYDGSSRIAPEGRWGVFPSFSFGWRVTEESFIQDLDIKWLNNAKIRASWGQLGNQNIDLYSYYALVKNEANYDYTFDNSSLVSGYTQKAYVNKNLKWETTTVTDVGLDLTLANSLNITFDWYKKKTTDILRRAQVTNLLGLEAPYINDGEMVNTGIELNVQYQNFIKSGKFKNLSYNVGFYLDRYRNKLTKFGAEEISSQSIIKEGIPYNTFYMLDCIGIFADEDEVKNSPKQFNDNTLPGDLKFRDANGDGVIDNKDRVELDGRFPKFEYAVNAGASWKGVDVSLLVSGVEGIKYYVTDWGLYPFRQGSAPTVDYVKNRWTEDNPNNAKYPRLYYDNMGGAKNTRYNSYFLKDASYLRLKNFTVGYTFPKALTQKAKIQQLRVFFSGDNLVTITDYPELDPERGGDGRFLNYPQNKVYAFGLNIQF